jgi:hypothetical protein
LPIVPFTAAQKDELREQLDALEFMADEPRGWTFPAAPTA